MRVAVVKSAASLIVAIATATLAQEGEPVLGTAASLDPGSLEATPPNAETIELAAGVILHDRPTVDAAQIATVEIASDALVLERRPAWLRVEIGGRRGWIPTTGAADRGNPWRAPVERLLANPTTTGLFTLATDLPPDSRGVVEAAIEALAAAYQQRFGLPPGPAGTEMLAVTAHSATWTELVALAAAPSSERVGFAVAGLAAVRSTADSDRNELVAAVVHEATHLLNRRHFGAAPPRWLDEAMAEDLSWCRLTADGLQLGSLSGAIVVRGGVLRHHGAHSALERVRREWQPGAPSVVTVLDQPAEAWNDDRSPLAYALAATTLRALLDSSHAPATLIAIGLVAEGEPLTAGGLLEVLGLTEQDLDRLVVQWLATAP